MEGITEKYREIQIKLLRIFKKVCKSNNIKYYLAGGTLLGAIRNQQIIPWDDDLDIVIFREDYYRLIEAMKKELTYPYEIQTSDEVESYYLFGIMRLRYAESTAATKGELADAPEEMNLGIWLDIQILDRTYENFFKRRRLIQKIHHWQILRAAKSYCKKYNRFMNLSKSDWEKYKKEAQTLSYKEIDKKIYSLIDSCNEGKYIASYAMHHKISETNYYKYEWFGEGATWNLEGTDFQIPQNYDRVLKQLYGRNYLEPPKKKNQNSGHENMVLNAERPYIRYQNLYREGRWKKNYQDKIYVLFGSGQQAEYYLQHEDRKYRPEYILDNDSTKWGKSLSGVPIVSPDYLKTLERDNIRVIIANIYWEEISKQLDKLDIHDYYAYVNSKAWEK